MHFTVDTMCGRLVSYLRFCGYDTEYIDERDAGDVEGLAGAIDRRGRTLVTRDARFAGLVDDAIHLRATAIDDQLEGLAQAGVSLDLPEVPVRCGRCNGRLEPTDPPGPDRPAYVPEELDESLYRCRRCGQYFWRGSHWDRVHELLGSIASTR